MNAVTASEFTTRIQPGYGLYDSDTAEALTYDELGITVEEYQAAIRESLDCAQAEGHIRVGERRVYAAE